MLSFTRTLIWNLNSSFKENLSFSQRKINFSGRIKTNEHQKRHSVAYLKELFTFSEFSLIFVIPLDFQAQCIAEMRSINCTWPYCGKCPRWCWLAQRSAFCNNAAEWGFQKDTDAAVFLLKVKTYNPDAILQKKREVPKETWSWESRVLCESNLSVGAQVSILARINIAQLQWACQLCCSWISWVPS